jgi:hypothetical protein
LGDAEKPIWDEACALFEELLDDLRTRNLLRRGTLHEERERLAHIWQNSRNYGMAFNEMHQVFDSQEKVEECSRNSGLSLGTLTYAFVAQLVGTALISFESVFKTSLLFFLKEEQGVNRRMTLGQMLHVIENISPSIGNRLKNMIDTRIRNSLAHGTFWFMEGGRVFLASDSYLNVVDEMTLTEFWIEAKKINIISIAFTDILHTKILEGYFR